MKTELVKNYFIVGFIWIALDMLLNYQQLPHFNLEELKIVSRPVVATLIISVLFVYLKNRKN